MGKGALSAALEPIFFSTRCDAMLSRLAMPAMFRRPSVTNP